MDLALLPLAGEALAIVCAAVLASLYPAFRAAPRPTSCVMRMRERKGGCRAGLPAFLLTLAAVMLNSRVCKPGKRGARLPRWAEDRSIPTFGFPLL